MSLSKKIGRRLRWYRTRFQVNNQIVGRGIELLGNRVRMDGLTYSVAAPQISRGHKSTLAFGLHEIEERELIRRWLPSDLPVLELGGGLGVVSCLTNRKLDRPDHHVVVEANPSMVPILKKNRDVNGCKFNIINKAIAYDCDHVTLNLGTEFVSSSVKDISFDNTANVAATTVENLLDEAGFREVGIVCDIEGIEADIIQREIPELGERVKFVMAEMHPAILGVDVVAALMDDMQSAGFTLKQQIGDCVFFSR
jgi:FkbM family methyltransferase